MKLYGTAQFNLKARACITCVFCSSSRVFLFKIVHVCRQLHENFVSHTRTCDITLHARVRTCMHAGYNART